MSVNKVILLGNLGKDPELRYTSQQFPVCTFSVATNERRKDASGNWTDHTEWHNVVVFGRVAENCANYLKKGRQAYIEGRLQTRKWQDKEGRDRYTTEIVAHTVQFVGGRAQASGAAMGDDAPPASGRPEMSREVAQGNAALDALSSADAISGPPAGEVSFDEDDIPF